MNKSHLNTIILLSLCLMNMVGITQNFQFNKKWESLGPNSPPVNKKQRSDAGIGPVEYIRIFEQNPTHLLAGSLSGGLFYSDDAGENWVNSGSDNWDYSGSPWADFFPADENIWFGCSNISGNNGNPGLLGKKGGIYRTDSKGDNWRLIGDYHDFGGFDNVTIYGTRFHPDNPNKMFVLTSRGLYLTENCLANDLNWRKVPLIDGIIYDLDFFQGEMYVSNFYHNQWSVFVCPKNQIGRLQELEVVKNENRKIRNLTIEPAGQSLLIAFDFSNEKDELYEYVPEFKSLELVLKGQKINFGSGHTLAVSPFDSNEFFFGIGTRIKKWDKANKRKIAISNKYHVDVEFVVYDPKDSLVVYLATHGGVFKTEDGGTTWNNKSKGLGISEVMGLAVSARDINQIIIGCFHDGSMGLADFNQDGNYFWRTINGGDGLLPLTHPDSASIIYTSNQYAGGGLSYSKDLGKDNVNLHRVNGLKTPGWEMAAVINHSSPNIVYFNFLESDGDNKGNINVCRINDRKKKNGSVQISNFLKTHQLKKYKVYGLFGSKYHPDELIAYVLDYVKNENGKSEVRHRLFRTQNLNGPPDDVVNSWHELTHPRNSWIGDVVIDGFDSEKIYVSYVTGRENPESMFGDRGMLFALRFKKQSPYKKKRQFDITANIALALSGRYNLAYDRKGGGRMFVATRKGVYYGTFKQLKDKGRWRKVGKGLPHCKVYGLDYNEKENVVTIGLFGRGVWRYYLK